MNVGDYVRTKCGIAKIVGTEAQDLIINLDKAIMYNHINYIASCTLDEIIKSSPQIIDLIEKNDLITLKNEYCKDEVFRVVGILKGVIELDLFEDGTLQIGNDDIKTIVTHEQFENVAYRVEE